MSEATKKALNATRSGLDCLMAGYILSTEHRTVKQLLDRGIELVGDHMHDKSAVRRFVYECLAQPAYVRRRTGSFWLTQQGERLQLLAKYRLTHALSTRVPVEGLFLDSPDPLALCELLKHADSGGTKTVQDLGKASGLSRKPASRFLHRMVSFGLAERTDVKVGATAASDERNISPNSRGYDWSSGWCLPRGVRRHRWAGLRP